MKARTEGEKGRHLCFHGLSRRRPLRVNLLLESGSDDQKIYIKRYITKRKYPRRIIPYPRPVRLRVVLIASAQTLRMSQTQGKKTDVQSEPTPACWGAVCAGADWSLSALVPTPTATSQKKDMQTENSARMHFTEGNNNKYI